MPMSVPCFPCISFSFNCGWQLTANVTLHCPGRRTAPGYVSPAAGRWGAQGAWSRREGHDVTPGSSSTRWVYPSSAAFLWPRDEMLLPVAVAHTVCQTRPAELCIKCMDLCHCGAVTALSAQSMSLICLIFTKRVFYIH